MAGKVYDEEDVRLARVIYCKSEYRGMQWLIEQMQADDSARYQTLQFATVTGWKKKDKANGIDWDELRRQKQVQRAQMEGSLAVNTAEDLQSKLLNDMLEITEMIRGEIQRQKAILLKQSEKAQANPPLSPFEKGEQDAENEKEKKDPGWEIVYSPALTRLLNAYQRAHASALSQVQRKIKDVDLSRLSQENQVFFLRRVFEDIGLAAGEIDPDFERSWKKSEKAVLARLRGIYGDEIITEVQGDLCLDAIIKRKAELDARRNSQADSQQSAAPGVHGTGPGRA